MRIINNSSYTGFQRFLKFFGRGRFSYRPTFSKAEISSYNKSVNKNYLSWFSQRYHRNYDRKSLKDRFAMYRIGGGWRR